MFKFILSFTMLICVSASAQNTEYKVLYKNEDKSSIEIIQDNETGMKGAVTNETVYKHFAADILKDQYDYFAKIKTKTLRYFSSEGLHSVINGEIYSSANPQKPITKFSHEADDIHFDSDNYLTVKYGCCGSPNKVTIYDYKHKSIVAGDNSILIADISSETYHTNIYSSIQSFYEKNDTLGMLTIAYTATDKYTIYLLSKKKTTFCNQYQFDYTLHTDNTDATIYSRLDGLLNYYSIFPKKQINTAAEINDIEYIIEYQCMAYSDATVDPAVADKVYSIKIPLINGKPFGKSNRIQALRLEVD